jgi:hypothetical protein
MYAAQRNSKGNLPWVFAACYFPSKVFAKKKRGRRYCLNRLNLYLQADWDLMADSTLSRWRISRMRKFTPGSLTLPAKVQIRCRSVPVDSEATGWGRVREAQVELLIRRLRSSPCLQEGQTNLSPPLSVPDLTCFLKISPRQHWPSLRASSQPALLPLIKYSEYSVMSLNIENWWQPFSLWFLFLHTYVTVQPKILYWKKI